MSHKKVSVVVALLAAALILSGCQAGQKTQEQGKAPSKAEEPQSEASGGGEIAKVEILTDADNGKESKIEVDEILTLELEGNPSTGYNWEVTALDENVLEKYGEVEFDPQAKNLVGAPGKIIQRFKGKSPGTCELKLNYARSWESVQPLKTFSIKVIVIEKQ